MPTPASTPPHAHRLRSLRSRYDRMKVHALLVTSPVDIEYLTGFHGEDSWLLVTASGRPVLISDARFDEEIDRCAPGVRKVMRTGALAEALEKTLQRRDVKTLGLQQKHATLALRQGLVKRLGASRLRGVDDGLLTQRAVKDEAELACIRRAVDIARKALDLTVSALRPGMTEGQVAALLDHTMRDLGASGPSFQTIVAADANSSLPHYRPGTRRLRRGGFVLIDFGARVGGYCSDLTRMVPLGRRLPPPIDDLYRIALDAQAAAIDAITPGADVVAVDKVARDLITQAGYGDQFGHGLGHGIGLEIHEQPSLSWRGSGQLIAGQVVTVEPGIYLPGVGGVRVEEDVLVTATGREVLGR